jgi:DNA replication and repair protein RecF
MIGNFRIEKIQSYNFRNLKNSIIEFGPNFNCIFGQNGNGKTNLIEAIYLVLNKKSFRKNTHFEQMLSTDCDKALVSVNCILKTHENIIHQKTVNLDQEKHEWLIDGLKTTKKHTTPVVFIGPFDGNNFFSRPTDKREWFDQHFSLLDPDYSKIFNRYTKTLRFRNALLNKKPSDYIQQLKIIEEQFAELSIQLSLIREKLLQDLNPFIEKIYLSIFSQQSQLKIKLKRNTNATSPQDFNAQLKIHREKELIIGHSCIGAHRDDYEILFNGWSALEYCSLGQLKMAYLALIFAYIELFRYKFSSFPLLIIDDVSGELDKERWGKLISYLSDCPFQVFITTANEAFKEELRNLKKANFFEVYEGEITKIS